MKKYLKYSVIKYIILYAITGKLGYYNLVRKLVGVQEILK
jgi:hypothetical protein